MKPDLPVQDPGRLEALIRELPKNDLHVHLDGSIRLQTLIELAGTEKIRLPSNSVEGLNTLLFKDTYADLEEYLGTFDCCCAVMQKPEHLERVAFELAMDSQADGVRYLEVRFAPQLHVNAVMDLEAVLSAVDKGLARARDEFNRRPEIRQGLAPAFHYGIIACALRYFGAWSDYYTEFIDVYRYATTEQICSLASLELAKAVVRIRDEKALPIVGFDLAGSEAGYPAAAHRKAYEFAHGAFLHKTVHAGEAYGPESIFQAISDLHADRIGHGFYLFDASRIQDPRILDKERYVRNLCQYIANRRITIEVCLTSALQTEPALKSYHAHSFGRMLENQLCTVICTNNRTVCKTTATREVMAAVQYFAMDRKSLKDCLLYGFKRSFFPDSYARKQAYVRQCADFFDQILDQHTPSECRRSDC